MVVSQRHVEWSPASAKGVGGFPCKVWGVAACSCTIRLATAIMAGRETADDSTFAAGKNNPYVYHAWQKRSNTIQPLLNQILTLWFKHAVANVSSLFTAKKR